MTLYDLSQCSIVVLGVTAIARAQVRTRPKIHRWSSLVGLVNQPAWFYSAWYAHQQGIFLISFVYSAVYLVSFWHAWILPWREHRFRGRAIAEHVRLYGEPPAGPLQVYELKPSVYSYTDEDGGRRVLPNGP